MNKIPCLIVVLLLSLLTFGQDLPAPDGLEMGVDYPSEDYPNIPDYIDPNKIKGGLYRAHTMAKGSRFVFWGEEATEINLEFLQVDYYSGPEITSWYSDFGDQSCIAYQFHGTVPSKGVYYYVIKSYYTNNSHIVKYGTFVINSIDLQPPINRGTGCRVFK